MIRELVIVAAVSAGLGFGSGWLVRGDCAKEVRATEATATAEATVTAEQIISNVKIKDIHVTNTFGDLLLELAAEPTAETIPAGCPARVLTDLELRVWDAGNQDGHLAVQPAGTDFAPQPAAPVADEGREGSGEEPPAGDGGVHEAAEPA